MADFQEVSFKKQSHPFPSPFPFLLLECRSKSWSTSIITGRKEGGCSLEGRIGSLASLQVGDQLYRPWTEVPALNLLYVRKNKLWAAIILNVPVIFCQTQPSQIQCCSTHTSGLSRWMLSGDRLFYRVRPVCFPQHISSTFSMEVEVSATEPFATDPGQGEFSLKKCSG